MKKKKFKLKLILTSSIIMISLLTNAFFTIEYQKATIAELNPKLSSDHMETSITLLDNPGKILCWNKTGSISAKLKLKSDDNPISGGSLSFWIIKNDNLTFYGEDITDSEGIANFSFFVDMLNGDYTYNVKFEGTSKYESSEGSSFFTVVADDRLLADAGIGITFATDGKFEFNYWMAVIDWEYGMLAHISHFMIFLYIFDNTGSLLGSELVKNEYYRWSGTIDHTHEVGTYTDTDEYIAGIHRGEMLDKGYIVQIFLYVEILWRFWFEFGEKLLPLSEIVNTNIIDDDTDAPKLEMTSSTPSKSNRSDGPYNIYFKCQDPSGFNVSIKYRFYDETDGSYSPIYKEMIGISPTPYLIPLTLSIPDSIWKLYPNTIVQFQNRTNDLDTDGGRLHDITDSGWRDYWINTGKILADVGGSLEIEAYMYEKDGNIWDWQLSSMYSTKYCELNVGDWYYFRSWIFNPLDDHIAIDNLMLSFDCSKFNQSNAPPTFIMDEVHHIWSGEDDSWEFDHLFDPSEFIFDGWESTVITIEVSFDYNIGVDPIVWHFSLEKTFVIRLPPEPTIQYLGTIGKFGPGAEGIYKFKDTAAIHYARFLITNNARNPLNIIRKMSTDSNMIKFGSNFYEIEIEDQINPGETKIVIFELTPITEFFCSEDVFFKLLFGLENDLPPWNYVEDWVKFLLDIVVLALEGKEVSAVTSTISFISNFIIGSWHALLTELADSTYESWSPRFINLESSFKWQYIQKHDQYDYFEYGYDTYDPPEDYILLEPSIDQVRKFELGRLLRTIAVGLYFAAAFLQTASNPYTYAAGIIASLAALALVWASDCQWNEANDDLPINEDYKNVYIPEYEFNTNITNLDTQNEFQESIVNLAYISIQLKEDLFALNETKVRKKAAQKMGDFNATLIQNEALIDYSDRLINDIEDFQNEIEIVSNHIVENSTEFIGGLKNVEVNVSLNGLPEKEIELYKAYGLNQTEILKLNATIVKSARNNDYSSNFTSVISSFSSTLVDLSTTLEEEKESLANDKLEAQKENTIIKIEILNETVKTADDPTLQQLNQLRIDISEFYFFGAWKDAVEQSEVLISLAEQVILDTNNNSYFVYIEFGKDMIDGASNYLKLDLFHLEEININDHESNQYTVLCRSNGAPTANYILQTNCSWVIPEEQTVFIEQYNRTAVEITVATDSDSTITPGTYYVGLRLYLPQTHTEKYSIIKVNVMDDDKTPPDIYIEYTGSFVDGDPGVWKVNVSDNESGLEEITIQVDGAQVVNDSIIGASFSKIYLIEVPSDLGSHTIEIFSKNYDIDWNGDQESKSSTGIVNINDDDMDPPILPEEYLTISDTIHEIYISLKAIDESGIKEVRIIIDDEFTVSFNELSGEFLTFIIDNYWNMDFGTHYVEIEVWDADEDRIDDSMFSIISGTFETSLEEMKQYFIWRINQLIQEIQDSSDDSWLKKNGKATMISKLTALKHMISENNFEEAYDKYLHDIKPKLTGLKTDENEEPWDKGVFKNPWVTSSELQEIFRVICNEILTDITVLIQTISTMEYSRLNNFNTYNSIVLNVNGMGGIYGYNIFLLIGLISIIPLFSYIRRKKKIINKFSSFFLKKYVLIVLLFPYVFLL